MTYLEVVVGVIMLYGYRLQTMCFIVSKEGVYIQKAFLSAIESMSISFTQCAYPEATSELGFDMLRTVRGVISGKGYAAFQTVSIYIFKEDHRYLNAKPVISLMHAPLEKLSLKSRTRAATSLLLV